ncbi:MAG TPA: hypothetical protein VGE59_03750 [Patescibacteria group bacterium]
MTPAMIEEIAERARRAVEHSQTTVGRISRLRLEIERYRFLASIAPAFRSSRVCFNPHEGEDFPDYDEKLTAAEQELASLTSGN